MNDTFALYQEIDRHLLENEAPGQYLNALNAPAFQTEYPFTMLSRLKKTEQSPVHHPEGNVWNHTILVLGHASQMKNQSSDPRVFMWAALLHDIGKAETTNIRRGRITSYDHDKIGAKQTDEFLQCFTDDSLFISKVSALVRWHMQILYVVKGLPLANVNAMKEQAHINDVALLGLCDRLGRLGADQKKEEADIRIFLDKTR